MNKDIKEYPVPNESAEQYMQRASGHEGKRGAPGNLLIDELIKKTKILRKTRRSSIRIRGKNNKRTKERAIMKKFKKIVIVSFVLSILPSILNGQERCLIYFNKEFGDPTEMGIQDIKKCHGQNVSVTIRSYTKKEFNEIVNLIVEKIDTNVFMDLCIQNIEDLDSLPNQLFRFKNITSLLIENTFFLTYFSPEICDLKHLERLIFFNTAIREIPSEIEKNTALRILEIVGTPIKTIPPGLISLPNLEEVELGVNDIQNSLKLYDDLSKLPSLRKFIICVETADELKGIDKLQSVEKISITLFKRKKSQYIFDYLKDLPNIKELSIDINKKIKKLPDDINNLTSIEELKLAGIRGIDNIKLPKLQRLIIPEYYCPFYCPFY